MRASNGFPVKIHVAITNYGRTLWIKNHLLIGAVKMSYFFCTMISINWKFIPLQLHRSTFQTNSKQTWCCHFCLQILGILWSLCQFLSNETSLDFYQFGTIARLKIQKLENRSCQQRWIHVHASNPVQSGSVQLLKQRFFVAVLLSDWYTNDNAM